MPKQYTIPSPQSSMGNCIWVADETAFYMLNAHDQDLFNRFQCRTLHSLGGPETVEIHNKHMLALSFKRPFLLHGMLAVTAVHDRYLGVTPIRRRSFCETYHWSQCTSLFKKSLGQPIKEEHKDPIWAAASTLGILGFASINACPLEETWPLGPPDSSDLEWLGLAAGKMRLWQLVDPLRETSIFTPMADMFASMHESLPIEGINGVLAELKQLCMLDETSTAYNNPYFRVAHGLSELLAVPFGQATLGKAMKFSTKIRGEFKFLLEQKDPVALTLLYLWYTRARESFSNALDSYDTWRKMLRECDESYVLVCDHLAEGTVRHHESFHLLSQAAKAGCHLCNLIELYCAASPIDPDLPVMLKFDIRDTTDRRCVFDVTANKEYTEIRLGLKDDKDALAQLAGTYCHLAGGIPDAIFDMLGNWLRQCQADHRECRHDSTTHIPTRLVDAPYLTLSHCWGRNVNIFRRTTGGNLEIPSKNLPRTFRDAITVTRKLGFTYLWIDSLCIIQGDKVDWERESSNMASIYSKGILNLAASYSPDSHGGLFLERNQYHVTSCSWKQQIDPVSSRNPWGKWMQSRQVCWTFDPQSEFDDLGLGRPIPLTSRGWVLQENVLSPRTVHFLPGKIIWECRELSATESIYCRPPEQSQQFRGEVASSPETVPVTRNGPKNFLRAERDKSGDQETTSEIASGSKSNQKPQKQLYSQWYDMVTQYSQKHLTRPEDRLPAIWALAQKFKDITGDEYFSGLWKDDILTGLLFKRFQPLPECRTRQTRLGPSWSWATTECQVEFQRANSPLSSSLGDMDRLPDASLQSFVINPSEPAALSMGRTCRAELEIQTLARKVVGTRYNWNPSPGERAAKVMGINTLWNGHRLPPDIWRRYEELSKEYDVFDFKKPRSLRFKEAWIREGVFHNGSTLGPSFPQTNCYFGWAGTQFIEEKRWEKRNKSGRSRGYDKSLLCGYFHLDFDTKELADTYHGKPVLCLHIKRTYGLLVELDGSSQMYRRVGIYEQAEWDYETDAWEAMIVTLV
ncbi:hypothetical protein FPRO06_02074 [Fusarium proliferatum]|nr:hypothetical protein FPRO06_02074 [Fusarium proliferatum]